MWPIGLLIALLGAISVSAQQYHGETIPTNLPPVQGAELAFFHINDPRDSSANLTLLNYFSHQANGNRVGETDMRRLVIVLHGSYRDGNDYMAHALTALNAQKVDPNVNQSTVAIMAPVFANDEDAGKSYPYIPNSNSPYGGAWTGALAWKGNQWSDGGNSIYPSDNSPTSSYEVLDQVIRFYDNPAMAPNLKQIVVAGHSRGSQMAVRYAAISQLKTRVALSYYVANPNGYAWLSHDRPKPITNCPTFDNYGDGYSNFSAYPMTYGTELVAMGRENILKNFNTKNIAYARGLRDHGDQSDTCGPYSTGADRSERFYNFIKAFPPTCADPKKSPCSTVDYVNAGHSDPEMFGSPAGQQRLFLDNFDGDGTIHPDMGYPRQQAGDDPFPDPSQGKH